MTATIGALEPFSVSVDEGDAALVARIGHADGVGVVGTTGIEALVAAYHRSDAGVVADRTECALFENRSAGRAADRAARHRLVDGSTVDVDAPAEFPVALLPGEFSLERADRRREGQHQRPRASFYWPT